MLIKIKSVLLVAVFFVTSIMSFTACSSEEREEEIILSPKQTLERIFTLAEQKDYNTLAGYCRSFSPYSVELYFIDTSTEYETEWTERYSDILYKLFAEYVTYKDLDEKTDMETRTATVTGTFTSLDMEKFNEMTDSSINAGLKNDFSAQMDYIDTVIGEKGLRSEPYELTIDFRYTDDEWIISEKSFLILLTLGYYCQ